MAEGELSGRRVVVIGGSSGIGFAVAARAIEAGAEVMIGSSDGGRVNAAVGRLGRQAAGSVVDVRDEASLSDFFSSIGGFDHLAFTAGDWGSFRAPRPMAELDIAQAGDLFSVRFWGAVAAVKHALGQISAEGSITVTNGVVAHRPRRQAALSTAMAGAIEHLTRALAVDLAPIRVNAVCPGLILTEVWNDMPADRREEQLKRMTASQPLPRAGLPAEVAEAYLYLMTGSYSTGQVLIVDGGRTLV